MNLANLKILIADDSKSLLMILDHHLREMGATDIVQVEDGESALFELKEPGDKSFDLVISDWVMPKMSGLDLLKKIRADFEFMHLPFLMIAGEDDPTAFHQAKGIGPTDIILKPFNAVGLAKKLSGLLAS